MHVTNIQINKHSNKNNYHSIKQGLPLLHLWRMYYASTLYMHVQISYSCMRTQGFQTTANQPQVSRPCPQLYPMDSAQSATGTLQRA